MSQGKRELRREKWETDRVRQRGVLEREIYRAS